MADNQRNESVILTVGMDNQEAIQGIQQIDNALDSTNKNKLDAGVKSFKQQLKEAREAAMALAAAGKENTAEYRAAATEIARLRDQQDVLNRTVAALDVGNRFQGVSKAAGLMASSIAGVQGSLVALGVSSDTANESIAKLQGLQSIIGLIDTIGDSGDVLRPFIANLFGAATATEAQAVATTEATVASGAQTVALEAQTIAQNTASTSAKALKFALASIGIGLLIAAIAYLVANFDEIKKSVTKLIPSLDGAGETFNKIKNIIVGVGNVVVQYLLAPVKAVIQLVQGNFKQAIAEMAKGLNVVKNFKDGQAVGERNDAEKRRKEQLERDIKSIDDRIEILKAGGKKTESLEREQFKRKLELAKDDDKQRKEIIQDRAVFEAGVTKRNQDEADKQAKEAAAKAKAAKDKADAERKQKLTELKKYQDDAAKIIQQGTQNERGKELAAIDDKYKIELSLAKKLGESTLELEKAKGIEKAAINKKYDDIITAYTIASSDSALNEFDKKRKEIDKQAEELIKNATPEQQAAILEVQSGLQNQNTDLQNSTNNLNGANSDLKNAELANAPSENDSPDVAKAKIEALAQARLDAENAAFQLKLVQLRGQNTEIEQAKKDHETSVTAIENEQTEARKAIAAKEKEQKLMLYDAIGAGATALSDIVGKETIAGKALAVAGALINTYAAIAGQLKAFAGVPIPGYAIAQAVVTGLAGFASVKNILSVKVPAKSGGSGAGQAVVPPTINSTVLNKASNGNADVQQSIETQKAEPVKAYIVNKDLQNQQQKDSFNKNISTF
ncbi:hypothetical protein [Pedobacter agri]|uniref:hypothetical protein n=1 Tax=Pedobacter agri TaxID=454586 RepID=UPI0029300DD7|nr:hypothetical protein [Pedobacter agri]